MTKNLNEKIEEVFTEIKKELLENQKQGRENKARNDFDEEKFSQKFLQRTTELWVQANKIPQSRFLSFLFRDCKVGFVEIRHIRTEAGHKDVKRFFIPVGDLQKTEIEFYEKYDAFFGVCTRASKSGTKKDVLQIPCLWVDYDYSLIKFAPLIEKDTVPPPSAIVSTGRGLHCYWLLHKPSSFEDIERVEDILKRLAYVTNSDLAPAEVARCLRIPGTINYRRGAAVLLLPLAIKDGKRIFYSLDDFDKMLPQIPEQEKKKIDWHIPLLEGVLDGHRHDSLKSLVGRYLSKGLEDSEIWDLIRSWNNKNYPPIPDRELEYQIKDLLSRYRNEDDLLLNLDSYTDTRMAERMKRFYGEDIVFCKERRRWFIWNDKWWEQDSRDIIIVQDYIKDLSLYCSERVKNLFSQRRLKDKNNLVNKALATQSQNRRKCIQEAARSEMPVSMEIFDQNPWLLNCRNGTLNLQEVDGKITFRGHRREDLMSKHSKIIYEPDALCPEWLKFLNLIAKGNEELIDYLQKIAGCCLTGIAGLRRFFFLYGPKASGKTTFIQTIREILGPDYARGASFKSFIARNEDRIRNDIASWKGYRIVSAPETEEGQKLAAVMIKSLTGGDTITERLLYHEAEEQTVTYKIILYGNEPPRVSGSDTAFHDRTCVIPFSYTIPETERIDNYRETYLYPELPGILNWCIEGCLKWQEQGLEKPRIIEEATEEYIREVNTIQNFIGRCCELNPEDWGLKIGGSILYGYYRKYCVKELGLSDSRIETQTAFGRYIKDLKVKRFHKPHVVYKGITIRDEWMQELDGV